MAKKTTQTTADENSAVVENKATNEEAKTVSFELEGKKYQFSASAPKKIRINNQSLTQEQIAKDSDLLIMLIGTPLIVKK